MNDIGSYNAGHSAGVAEGKRGGTPGYGFGLFDRLQQDRKNASMQDDILSLKKRLAGLSAVKDALKAALRDVAPNHPLINPMEGNPELLGVYRTAAAKVTSADDQV